MHDGAINPSRGSQPAMIIGRSPAPSISGGMPPACRQPRASETIASSGRTRRASTSPRRCSANPSLPTTWLSTAWCMRASCASPAATRRSRRSTRPRSGAPRKGRSRSFATATSSRFSARTKRSSKPSPPSRQITSPGTGSTRSTRSRKRRAGCCNSPRSTGPSAPLPYPILQPRPAGNRRPIPGCTSPTPRSRRPVGSLTTATGGLRCGPIRKGCTRCAMRWRGP